MTHSLQIHLLYASILWLATWLITSLQRVTATTKYWMWVVTAFNFILPLSLAPGRLWPDRVSWFTPGIAPRSIAVTEPLIAIWIAGVVVMMIRLCLRIRGHEHNRVSPAVVGLVRPRIEVPRAVRGLLDPQELDAVVAHEQRHARRRDNLIRLLYELSLCALWFHPLVWMTGSRLALYRELSCDDAVGDRQDLISALAKLANPENERLLHAGASSFMADRMEHLAAGYRVSRAANAVLAAAFAALVVAAVVSPVAESAAGYFCALTRGVAP
jgi:Zn-dependent protease with chaperone function